MRATQLLIQLYFPVQVLVKKIQDFWVSIKLPKMMKCLHKLKKNLINSMKDIWDCKALIIQMREKQLLIHLVCKN